MKFDAETIVDIIKLLVGHVDAIAETNYDTQSLNNLKKLCSVIDSLLDEVQKLVPDAKKEAFSVANIGCYSIGYLARLKDDITGWLEQRW